MAWAVPQSARFAPRAPQWLKDKTINLILQIALRKHPDYPDVPLALDFVKDPNDRKVME